MKRFGYFEKLSLAARWFLPQDEAESVIDDYRDILSEIGEQKEAVERFGKPWRPVMELADSKKVRRWHMFLTIMIFCALTPLLTIFWESMGGHYDYFLEPAGNILLCGIVYLFGLDVIFGGSNSKIVTWVSVIILSIAGIVVLFMNPVELLDALFSPIERMIFGRNFPNYFKAEHLIFIGAIISVIYFGLGKTWKKPFKKSLILGICAALFAILCIYGFVMYCFHVNFGPMLHVLRVNIICKIGAVLLFCGAVLGIMMAKMFDSRWRAVYILCIAGMVICFETYNIIWNMSPSLWMFTEEYSIGMMPTDEWVQNVTAYLTWDLGCGLVLAAIGLL